MNNEEGKIWYGLGIDTQGLERDANKAASIFRGIGSQAASDCAKMNSGVNALGESVAKLGATVLSGAAVAAFGKQIINVRGEMQLLEQSFEVLTGSAEKSKSMLSDIVGLATDSPLEMQPVAKAAQTLMGFGVEADNVMGILRQLSDVSMGNQQRFESLALVYAQTQSAGKLMGQDLLQYINAGFNPLAIIAEQTGKSMAVLKEEMSEGAISAKMVADAFTSATSEGGKFYDMTKKQADTIVGVRATFEDSITQMFNNIGKDSEEFIKSGFEMSTSLVQNYETIGKALASLIATYGTYKAAVLVATTVEKLRYQATLAQMAGMTKMQTIMDVLRAKTAALNKTMLANPYVLLATAVVAVGAALWTFSQKADKATDAMKRFNDEQERLRGEIDTLMSVVQSDTATMYQKVKAYDELTKKSKALTDAYSMEELASLKSADAQTLLNKERDAKEYDEIVKQVDAARKSVEMYQEALSTPQMGGMGASGASLANSIGLSRAQKDLEAAEELLEEYNRRVAKAQQIAKNGVRLEGVEANITLLTKETSTLDERNRAYEKLKELSPELASMYDQEAISLMSLAQAQEAASRAEQIATLRKEKMTNEGVISNMEGNSMGNAYMGNPLQGVIDDIKLKNASIDQQIADLLNKPLPTTPTGGGDGSPLAGTIKAYEEDNKRLKKLQEETTKNSEQFATYQHQIEANNLKISQINGALRQEMADATLKVEEEAHEAEMALKRSQTTDKIALIKLETAEQLEAIKEQKQAFAEKYKGQEDTQEYKSGMAAFDSLASTVTAQGKSQEAQVKKEAETENQQYLDNLYKQYATYEKRKEAIRKEYDKKRKALQADGASQEVIDNLNNTEAEEIKVVDNEAFDSLKSGANIIAQVFDDTAKRTNKQINTLRKQTEELMAYLANTADADITVGFGMSAEQLKTLKASPDQLKAISDALDELYDKGSKQNPFAQLATDAKNLFSKGGFDMSNIEDFSSSLNSVTGMITNVTGGLKEMFEASGNEKGAAIVGGIEEGLSAVSNIASGFAQGGIIGGAMAAVGELINGFTKGAQVEAEHQAKLEEIRKSNIAQQEAYNQLLREQNLLYEEGNNLLSKDAYGTATNAIAQAKKDAVTLKADIAKLGQVDIETGSYTTGALWWKKQHTTYTDLLELYPDLIDANGQLDTAMAQTILDTRGMSDAHRQLLEDAIESQEAFEESIGVMRDYLEDTFGDMGNQLSDSLVDAFKNGENAAEAFGNTVNSMIENMVSDLVYSAVFADLFNNASKEIAKVQTGFNEDGTANEYANMSEEEKLTAQMGILSGLMGGIEGKMSEAEQLLEWAKQEGQKQGLNGFMESTEERSASSKGIATASQESVDENNGRLTAIQGHTYGIFERVAEIASRMAGSSGMAVKNDMPDYGAKLCEISSEMLNCMYGVKDNTEYCRHLERIDENIRRMQRDMNSIYCGGIVLKKR